MTTVVYQGIPGSYSHIAALHLFPNDKLVGNGTFREVFEFLKKGKANYAVMPIENTIIGSLNEVYDLITEYNFHIKAEITLKIDHNLLGSSSTELKNITKAFSHEKALSQCHTFLHTNRITPEIFEDTAAAAAYISLKKTVNEAAIASQSAAKIYGLKVLKKNIQDNKHNYTRFIVIQKTNNSKSGTKTTLMFVVSHKPGSLLKSLNVFASNNLNLTHLESRPVLGKPFNYKFYLDFEHQNNTSLVDQIIIALRPHTKLIQKLGTYKKGETITESTNLDTLETHT